MELQELWNFIFGANQQEFALRLLVIAVVWQTRQIIIKERRIIEAYALHTEIAKNGDETAIKTVSAIERATASINRLADMLQGSMR